MIALGELLVDWCKLVEEKKRKENCASVSVRGRYDGKKGGKLLTTKYSEREIRVTKRGRGGTIQQLSEGNVICL